MALEDIVGKDSNRFAKIEIADPDEIIAKNILRQMVMRKHEQSEVIAIEGANQSTVGSFNLINHHISQ